MLKEFLFDGPKGSDVSARAVGKRLAQHVDNVIRWEGRIVVLRAEALPGGGGKGGRNTRWRSWMAAHRPGRLCEVKGVWGFQGVCFGLLSFGKRCVFLRDLKFARLVGNGEGQNKPPETPKPPNPPRFCLLRIERRKGATDPPSLEIGSRIPARLPLKFRIVGRAPEPYGAPLARAYGPRPPGLETLSLASCVGP